MTRFMHRKDIKKLINKSTGFNKRRYGSLTMWAVSISLLIFFLFTLSVNFELYQIYSKVQFASPQDVTYFILFMSIISLVVITYLLCALKIHRFTIQALEFQNTLYSSSLKVNALFCIIANQDHTIVYSYGGTEDIFSKYQMDTIDNWIESSGVSDDSKNKITQALSNGKSEQFSISYNDSANKKESTLLVISAIDKPKGYFFIKATRA